MIFLVLLWLDYNICSLGWVLLRQSHVFVLVTGASVVMPTRTRINIIGVFANAHFHENENEIDFVNAGIVSGYNDAKLIWFLKHEKKTTTGTDITTLRRQR